MLHWTPEGMSIKPGLNVYVCQTYFRLILRYGSKKQLRLRLRWKPTWKVFADKESFGA